MLLLAKDSLIVLFLRGPIQGNLSGNSSALRPMQPHDISSVDELTWAVVQTNWPWSLCLPSEFTEMALDVAVSGPPCLDPLGRECTAIAGVAKT